MLLNSFENYIFQMWLAICETQIHIHNWIGVINLNLITIGMNLLNRAVGSRMAGVVRASPFFMQWTYFYCIAIASSIKHTKYCNLNSPSYWLKTQWTLAWQATVTFAKIADLSTTKIFYEYGGQFGTTGDY